MENKKQNKLVLFPVLLGLFSLILIGQFEHVYGDEGSKIEVYFCNGGAKSVTENLSGVTPGLTREICIGAKNKGKEQHNIELYFVDGLINSHTPQFISCGRETDKQKDFGKYASFRDDGETKRKVSFMINPGETVEKKAEVTFPANYAGISKGCLITVAGNQDVKKGKINIKLRRGNIIKAVVNEEIAIEAQKDKDIIHKVSNLKVGERTGWANSSETLHGASEIGEDNLKVLAFTDGFAIKENVKTGEVFVSTKLENIGNVNLRGIITLKVTNNFGYSFNKKVGHESLTPKTSKLVNIAISKLPIYKGKYNVEMEVRYIPEFDIDLSKVPETLQKEIVKQYKGSFSIFPLAFVIEIVILSLILIVLILIYVRKKKMSKYLKEYIVKKGDSITSIADMFGCNWKQIVKMNSIDEPYTLEEKTVIIVYDLSGIKSKTKNASDVKIKKRKIVKTKAKIKTKQSKKLAVNKVSPKKELKAKSVSKKVVKKVIAKKVKKVIAKKVKKG